MHPYIGANADKDTPIYRSIKRESGNMHLYTALQTPLYRCDRSGTVATVSIVLQTMAASKVVLGYTTFDKGGIEFTNSDKSRQRLGRK